MMEDKPAWLLAGHVGIIGHDRIMVSLYKPHHTNQGIRATDRLSVNVVDEKLLPRADYVGITSGAKTDKSGVFKWHLGEGRTPVIEDSPLVMEAKWWTTTRRKPSTISSVKSMPRTWRKIASMKTARWTTTS